MTKKKNVLNSLRQLSLLGLVITFLGMIILSSMILSVLEWTTLYRIPWILSSCQNWLTILEKADIRLKHMAESLD